MQRDSTKPVRPDAAAFKAALEQVDVELRCVAERLEDLRLRTEQAREQRQAQTTDAQRERIRSAMDEIRQRQAQLKVTKQKTVDQVKQMEEAVKTKISEMQATKKRLPFKSVEELDRRVQELEQAVDSGALKLVDEKRHLAEISMLRRLRKMFAEVIYQQTSIDHDKQRIMEIRGKLEDPISKALSEEYDKLKAEQNLLREEQDQVYQTQRRLYEERTILNQKRTEAYEKRKRLQDAYYASLRTYQEYERGERSKAQERRQQQEEYQKEKRKLIAEKMLEEAGMPAFLEEIHTCESLIRCLDPSAVEQVGEEELKDSTLPVLQNVRTVTKDMEVGTVLKSKTEREDYFIRGSEKKKSHKRHKKASMMEENVTGNFMIDMATIQQFSFVGVTPPFQQTDIPVCIERLRERIQWYKDNEANVVAERIENVKKEIEEMEAKALQNQEKKQGYPSGYSSGYQQGHQQGHQQGYRKANGVSKKKAMNI